VPDPGWFAEAEHPGPDSGILKRFLAVVQLHDVLTAVPSTQVTQEDQQQMTLMIFRCERIRLAGNG